MPWGHSHQFICIDCGSIFDSTAVNPLRCPEHRKEHNRARVKQNYRLRRGDLFGVRPTSHPWSDMQRFNYFITKTCQSALCGACGQHMSVCKCIDHDPGLRTYQPVEVPTWKPWK